MNLPVLIRYISHTLHTFVRICSPDGQIQCSVCDVGGLEDTLIKQPDVYDFLLHRENTDLPIIKGINDTIAYVQFFVDNNCFLVGPVSFSSPLYPLHQLEHVIIDSQLKNHLSVFSYHHFCEVILFFYNVLATEPLLEETFISCNFVKSFSSDQLQQDFSDYLFERQESEQKHNPYDQECREQKSIEDGDIEQLKRSIAEDYSGNLGVLSHDSLRNFKNLCIVVITLASRSAIRGGMSPELSFSLSDNAIQRIEAENNLVQLEKMLREIEIQYAQMVNEIKKAQKGTLAHRKNPHIIKCKDYIFSHLHDKITMDDLAYETGCSPNYLSQLFKEHEGISPLQYILREKINRAKNLLVYSDYTYSEIATYLGFSSQSHLGKQFLKFTGYTPMEYRRNFMRQNP